ncbi:hypothetical protein HRI_001949200 [Hibiscus trionum]|uniref:PHD-type zinc finger plants domain-containing protein n=1 Tax=Hibiscus trionum TaxID=183268 RepID=A0A9W7HRF9_HIBTR|nr:hypothetical protein HRI_001949200 [Hibiscus trionum]
MTANKEKSVPIISQQSSLVQCCMCGDSGLTHELLQCKVCHFRSQHRYCSNLYPKAESYQVCNWCLNQNMDSKPHNSSASSPSCKDNSEAEEDGKNKRKGDYNNGCSGTQRNKNLKLRFVNRPKSPEKRPPCTTRKRIISNARLEEKLATRKSKDTSNGGLVTRHVFRNKVRRYKLLDEVSS